MPEKQLSRAAFNQRVYRERKQKVFTSICVKAGLVDSVAKAVRYAADGGDPLAREIRSDNDSEILTRLEQHFFKLGQQKQRSKSRTTTK